MIQIKDLIEIRAKGRTSNLKFQVDQFLSERRYSPESRMDVAEFYVWEHNFRRALEYVPYRELLNLTSPRLGRNEVRALTLYARILNGLGASTYSRRLCKKIAPYLDEVQKWRISAIYGHARCYREVILLLQSIEKKDIFSLSGEDSQYLLSLARAYGETGNLVKAKSILQQFIEWATINRSDTSKAAPIAVMGYLNMLDGNYRTARKLLEKSIKMYALIPGSSVVGHAYLWLGACLSHEGRYQDAERFFDLAWPCFYRPGLLPEFWLQVYFWRGFSEFRAKNHFPESWARLIAYPGSWAESDSGFSYLRLIQKEIDVPKGLKFSIGSFEAKYSDAGKFSFDSGLLPDQLAKQTIISGRDGLPVYRAYETLWPLETGSIFQLPKRLEQIRLRLKRQGVIIKSKDGQLTCVNRQKWVRWKRDADSPVSFFFSTHSTFIRKDVEEHFKISRTKAALLCNKWAQDCLITAVKRGRSTFYRTGPIANDP